MRNSIRTGIYYFIGRNRNSIIIRLIAKICVVFVNAYYTSGFYKMKYNGEELVIRKISKTCNDDKVVVFDVGANIGEYAALANKYFSDAAIHCFELFPDNYELLKNNEAISSKNVTLNCIGLSDSTREVEADFFPRDNRKGGIQSIEWDKKTNIEKKVIKVKVVRGDEYVDRHQIGAINILKIDTEGHEFFVLKGFDKLLSAGLIDVVQFEHGRAAIPTRTMLVDFYEYLTPLGYLLGRLHPGGVALKPHDSFDDEYGSTGNYVAIHKNKKDIIASLNITPGRRA